MSRNCIYLIATYRDKIDRNFQDGKIDYILSKNKRDSRGHMSFTAWIPPALHVSCHISTAFSIWLRYFFPSMCIYSQFNPAGTTLPHNTCLKVGKSTDVKDRFSSNRDMTKFLKMTNLKIQNHFDKHAQLFPEIKSAFIALI
jgi:hypothetical protein